MAQETNKSKKETEQENKFKNPKQKILEDTAKQYFQSAEDEFKKQGYNSALVLFIFIFSL